MEINPQLESVSGEILKKAKGGFCKLKTSLSLKIAKIN
jgi:hypothetical protein